MPEYQRSQTGQDCEPTGTPADQPQPPVGSKCSPLPETEAPTLPDLKDCPPPEHCKCSTTAGAAASCLEKLIAEQTASIIAAERTKVFKSDLEQLVKSSKTAGQEYTREKYEKLLKQWKEQDTEIASLVRKLVCAVSCWNCAIECYVCPLLKQIYHAEQRLYGDGTQYEKVLTIQDVLYWRQQDKDAKERRFHRIKTVLSVWEKPGQTIEKALSDNAKLITEIGKSLGAETAKAVYDVFFKLIPLHLSIAPPSDSTVRTSISKEHTQFCEFDKGEPDTCCGPDVGKLSIRQRLIGGPTPYLIDPKDYMNVVCCLVEHRYGPAKKALGDAEAEIVTVVNEIARLKALVDNGVKQVEKDAKAAMPTVVECCDKALNERERDSAAGRAR